MKHAVPLLWLFLMMGLAQAAWADGIPMVGMENDGKAIEVIIPSRVFRRNLTHTVSAVHDSALVALGQARAGTHWNLRTAVVGVGVNLEVGLGPIIKASATPRFQLLFSNSKDPVLP